MKQQRPKEDKFHGEIIIRDGDVRYQDMHGWTQAPQPLTEHLIHISAHLLEGNEAYMPFQMTADTATGDARHLDIDGGLHLDGHDLSCEVRYDDINLAFIQHVLPAKLPLTLASGQVDGRLQFTLLHDRQTGKPCVQVTAVADLRDARGNIALFHAHVSPYHILRGQIRITDRALELADLHAEIGGVPLQVNGEIANFKAPIFALQLQTAGADTPTLIRQIPALARLPYTWHGKMAAWAQVTGPLRDLQVIGHVQGPSLATSFGRYSDLAGDVSYIKNALHLANLTGQGFGGHVAGNAWISLQAPHSSTVFIDGQAERVDLHQVIAQFVPPTKSTNAVGEALRDAQGVLSGPVTIRVDARKRVTVVTHGHGQVMIHNLAPGQLDADLQLDIAQKNIVAHLNRAEVLLPEGYFQAQGQIGTDTGIHLAVRGNALNLHLLGAHLRRADVFGSGYLLGEVNGPLNAPRFAGTVQAKDGSVAGHAFTDFASDVQGSLGASPALELGHILLLANGNQVQLSGLQLTNFSHLRWTPRGTLLLHPTTLQALQGITGTHLPLQGAAEGVVHFSEQDGHPEGTLLLRHPRLTLGAIPVQFDRATFHFDIDNAVIHITEAQVRYHGATVSVTGTLPFDQNTLSPQGVKLSLNAQNLNLDDFTTLVACDNPHAGQFTADARLALPLDVAAHFNLNASLSALLMPEGDETMADVLARTLVVQASVDGGDSLSVAGVPFREANAALEYQGETHALRLDRLNIARQTAEGGYGLALTEPASLDLLTREIDLHALLQGVPQTGKELAPPCDIERLRRDILLIAANSIEDSGALNAGGMLLDGAGSRHDAAHRLPPLLNRIVRTLDNIPQPFAGKGAFNISLAGALQQPVITAELNCTEMVIGGNTAPNLSGSLAYDPAPRMLIIDHLQATGRYDPDATAEVAGTITLPVLDAQGHEINPGPLNLSASMQNVQLEPARCLGA